MRVVLYHPWVYLRSGVERWMVELVTRSRHDWTVVTHHHDPAGTYPEVAALDVVELAPRVSVRRSLGPLVHAARTMAGADLPDSDAVLVSSEGLGDLVALRARVPVAAYCHTPLKILHDPVAHDAVRRQSPARRAALSTLGPAFEAVDRRAWRRYDHVLVNSAETLERVRAAGLQPRGPLEVLEPGVDTSWATPSRAPREAVFLCAGRVMWQKNVELAIDALRLLDRPARLVVAGAVDEKSRDYLADLRSRATGLPVEFEVAPSDARLRELYATATALLFTPRNEDFGMVVLEAQAAGTPVLAVDAGGPRWTVEDGRTGWLLPPTPEAFADRMRAVLDRPGEVDAMRPACTAAALARGWDAHVRRLDDVMDEVVLDQPSRAASSAAASGQVRGRGRPTGRGSRRASDKAAVQAATSPTGT